MEEFELVALSGGIHSLRSRENGQTFHPVVGPAAEAETIHVGGTRLVERANALPPGEPFVIWDVGLGAAANALAAVRALRVGHHGRNGITLLSFDQHTAAVEFALVHAGALGYPLGDELALGSLVEHQAVRLPVWEAMLDWKVFLGDFPALLASNVVLPAPHAVFFDPYSPTVNAEMWTLETFAALHRRTRPETLCLLTTYTRSTAVRVTLLRAGFFVGVGGATGEKDETTVAANTPALLEHPLGRDWLEKKVYASTNAAPLRAGGGTAPARQPIGDEDFTALRAHPQFRDAV